MDLTVFSEIYIKCKYLNPGQSLSVLKGQRGGMGQLEIGIFHGFARAGQKRVGQRDGQNGWSRLQSKPNCNQFLRYY